MALVPFSYSSRSLFRRSASTALTVASIGATVAVFSGVLALQQGFATLFSEHGRDDIAVMMRPGATSEGESSFPLDRADIVIKSAPEIAVGEDGQPLASGETYLAVRMRKHDGGETNVPIRGVSPATFTIRAGDLEIIEGRRFESGTDEVIVGRSVPGRISGTQIGDVITFNTTPCRVVGIFACEGPFESEIWGDVDRMQEALERRGYNRIIAMILPDATIEAMAGRLAEDKQVPASVMSERAYMNSQTSALSSLLLGLGTFLALVMGAGAVFTGTNTMLSAVAARTQEIGILLALGFRPVAIFITFLWEALLLGLVGGVIGCLMALPLNGINTGTTNFNTFTEVAFAFRMTPRVLITAVIFSIALGVLGGAWPAWRAARLRPTAALRRE